MGLAGSVRPPALSGLTYVRPIGAGGYADVFLYTEEFPAREVAVKVLREAADAAAMEQFRAEVNVMAQLAAHPAIVSVYRADTAEDGRACLVMQYCPPPHPGDRFRSEQMPLAEVLEIAIKVSSAVETAHRAGILHRDIKPHNILSGAFGPMLTDFGIASATGDVAGLGLSVPWSPPEAFDETAAPDVRSDVYSLAATVYSLLAGRSPFEVPGAANDMPTLMDRIERQEPSHILRSDLPASLQSMLLGAMSRSVEGRPESAMAFAHQIQGVQEELSLSVTQLEVMDASPSSEARPVTDSRTEVRPISIIIPEEIAERGTLIRPRSIPQSTDRTDVHPVRSRSATPDTRRVSRDAHPPQLVAGPPSASDHVPPHVGCPEEAPRPEVVEAHPKRSRVAVLLPGVTVLGIAVLAWFALHSPADPTAEEPPQRGSEVSDAILGGIAPPTDLRARRVSKGVQLSWRSNESRDGDTYLVATGESLGSLDRPAKTAVAETTVDVRQGRQVCISVMVVRSGAASAPLEDCVVAP